MRDYIREEAAYREALALGLDRDDMIVRRRLRQKLEFVSEDLATRSEPSDAELQGFLQAHGKTFQTEPLFSFRQMYFNPRYMVQTFIVTWLACSMTCNISVCMPTTLILEILFFYNRILRMFPCRT